MQLLQASNILGVDLSNHQGTVDFSQFKQQGIQFVFLKASEGDYYHDQFFDDNVQKAKAVSIPVGAYHFAQPDNCSAQSEATFFLSVIKDKNLELCPVLDIEVGNIGADDLEEWIKTFRSIVEPAIQMRLMLYTGKWFADRKNEFNNAFSDMPLWYANYTGGNLATVELPDFGGWTDWVAWQFADDGAVVGVNGRVDMNYARSIDAISQSLKPQFRVYQQTKLLNLFVSQEEAIAFAKQWDHSSVVRISDNAWMWDNYPTNEKGGIQMDKDAVQKVIAILGAVHNASGDAKVQDVLHQTANYLRSQAGLPTD